MEIKKVEAVRELFGEEQKEKSKYIGTFWHDGSRITE